MPHKTITTIFQTRSVYRFFLTASVICATCYATQLLHAQDQTVAESQQDEPTADTPEGDTPKGDTPKDDTPKADAPKGDTPKGDTPKGDTPKGDTPKGDTPKGDAPKGDAPKADAPKGDTPKGDMPKGDKKMVDDKSKGQPNSEPSDLSKKLATALEQDDLEFPLALNLAEEIVFGPETSFFKVTDNETDDSNTSRLTQFMEKLRETNSDQMKPMDAKKFLFLDQIVKLRSLMVKDEPEEGSAAAETWEADRQKDAQQTVIAAAQIPGLVNETPALGMYLPRTIPIIKQAMEIFPIKKSSLQPTLSLAELLAPSIIPERPAPRPTVTFRLADDLPPTSTVYHFAIGNGQRQELRPERERTLLFNKPISFQFYNGDVMQGGSVDAPSVITFRIKTNAAGVTLWTYEIKEIPKAKKNKDMGVNENKFNSSELLVQKLPVDFSSYLLAQEIAFQQEAADQSDANANTDEQAESNEAKDDSDSSSETSESKGVTRESQDDKTESNANADDKAQATEEEKQKAEDANALLEQFNEHRTALNENREWRQNYSNAAGLDEQLNSLELVINADPQDPTTLKSISDFFLRMSQTAMNDCNEKLRSVKPQEAQIRQFFINREQMLVNDEDVTNARKLQDQMRIPVQNAHQLSQLTTFSYRASELWTEKFKQETGSSNSRQIQRQDPDQQRDRFLSDVEADYQALQLNLQVVTPTIKQFNAIAYQNVIPLSEDSQGVAQLRTYVDNQFTSLSRRIAETTLKYSDWKKSWRDGNEYYYSELHFRPDEVYYGVKKHCVVYFPHDPNHVYFYNPSQCHYWGRYIIGARDNVSFSSTPSDRKRIVSCGTVPLEDYGVPGPMPTILGALNPNQKLISPPSPPGAPASQQMNVMGFEAASAPAPPAIKYAPAPAMRSESATSDSGNTLNLPAAPPIDF